MTVHLILPDIHAHWEHDNARADLVSKLIADINPDVVVNIGDTADMPSLASYDQGKRAFNGRTYRADIDVSLDFNDRLWSPLKARKKKMPRRVFLEGNHEHRIERALDLSPELVGTIGLKDLELEEFYNDVVLYSGNTPGVIVLDGISYAHYFVSGIKGLPLGGEHPGYTHITKLFTSSTSGHSHLLDYSVRTDNSGRKLMGLQAGCFIDFPMEWAGETNRLWWRGVVVKRSVENGSYDPQFISLNALRKEYGTNG